MARNEFKPPSDFVDGDSGGGGNKVWKWLGIGCGVILLVLGGAMALGAFKTVSCCSELYDTAQSQMQAAQFGQQFSIDLANGQVEQARAKMTDSLQQQISAQDLSAKLDEHETFLARSMPQIADVMNLQQSEEAAAPRWEVSANFAPPTGDRKLVVLMEIVGRGEEEQREFLVDSLVFEERERDLRAEPPAREVLAFHGQLRNGNYEAAYNRMSKTFRDQSDAKAFRRFVRDQNAVFRSGQIGIQSVEYQQQGEAARVIAHATGSDEQRAEITYALVRRSPVAPWKIDSIEPTYQAAAPAPEPDAAGEAADETDAGDAPAQEVDAGDEAAQ